MDGESFSYHGMGSQVTDPTHFSQHTCCLLSAPSYSQPEARCDARGKDVAAEAFRLAPLSVVAPLALVLTPDVRSLTAQEFLPEISFEVGLEQQGGW